MLFDLPQAPNLQRWTTIYKKKDEIQNSTSATYVEDTELRFPVAEGFRYLVSSKLWVFADSGSDFKFNPVVPTNSLFISFASKYTGLGGTGTFTTQFADGVATIPTAITPQCDFTGFRRALIEFELMVDIKNAGEFVLNWSPLAGAGGGNTVNIYAGSWLSYFGFAVDGAVTTK